MASNELAAADVSKERLLLDAILGVPEPLAQPAPRVEAAAAGAAGEGTSPVRMIRFLRTRGSGSGTAERSATVYGWRGWL